MPLLLANFSHILSAKQDFKTLLLKFGSLSALLGIAVPVVFEHYVMGLSGAADRLAKGLGEQFFLLVRDRVFKDGYLAYNIFVDLFLCTLFLFFLTYHFKCPVRRGRVICFRLLSILPVAYELACIVLKAMCKNGNITLPLYVSPFLTTKPPLMFAAFIALALFIKRREIIFLKNGRSYEEYGRYLETNTNALHFSVYAFVIFVIAALIDMLLLALIIARTMNGMMAIVKMSEQGLENSEVIASMLSRTINVSEAAGIGESVDMIFIAPLVLLYSYTRKHRNTMIDMAIPVASVAAIAVIYAEAFFLAVCQLPDLLNTYLQSTFGIDISQIDIEKLKQVLTTLVD